MTVEELAQLATTTTSENIPAAPDQPATGQVVPPPAPCLCSPIPAATPSPQPIPLNPSGSNRHGRKSTPGCPSCKTNPTGNVSLPSGHNNSVAWLHLGPESQWRQPRTPSPWTALSSNWRSSATDNQLGSGQSAPTNLVPSPAGWTFLLAAVRDHQANYSPVLLPLDMHSSGYQTYGEDPGTVGIEVTGFGVGALAAVVIAMTGAGGAYADDSGVTLTTTVRPTKPTATTRTTTTKPPLPTAEPTTPPPTKTEVIVVPKTEVVVVPLAAPVPTMVAAHQPVPG
ncbi:hypothetical protein [Saccharothrix sp.]|uniref:hypothetical protein n=1 Tax=Saccharothrix sp. TaxID=1873460 RepID=UPI0028119B77|nr:hypothetical protein [Saccharothrix sp.]